jgi:hypothetical protein
LLFGLLVALVGEWLLAGITWPLFSSRRGRYPARHGHFLQPLYDLLKLAGRRRSANWPGQSPPFPRPSDYISLGCVLAPTLALALLPFPGSPLGSTVDLLTLLALLAAQPLLRAYLRLEGGGLAAWRGAQDLGRLLTGLLPVLLVVAALAGASGSRSLLVSELVLAPETWQQSVVRLLAGAALLVTLPWWLDWREAHLTAPAESAGTFAGRLLQAAALAAFWSLLVLPRPGELSWAVLVAVAGSLFAYVAIGVFSQRWAPARPEREAASLMWATALPVAAVALIVALWPMA